MHHHRRGRALAGACADRLFISVFLIAACGLIYELIAGTLASYLLGDSVFQFSTIIGSLSLRHGNRKLSVSLSGARTSRAASLASN